MGRIKVRFRARAAGTAPIINDQSFSVLDSAADNSAVGTVQLANSPSPSPTWSITAGNTGTTFAIDSSTGAITVIEPGNLVADADYTLTVQASNASGSDTASVTVAVNDSDVEDMTPVGDLTNATDETYYRRGWTGALPTIIYTPAELIAANLIPPYSANFNGRDGNDVFDALPSFTSLDWTEMGLVLNLQTAGAYPERGPITGWQYDWLVGNDDGSNMLKQGLAAGSLPCHTRVSGLVTNLIDYPEASLDPRESPDPATYFDIAAYVALGGTPGYLGSVPDDSTAHHPPLPFIPYLATRHITYLVEVQDHANYGWQSVPWTYRLNPLQCRQQWWNIRNIFHAYVCTPDGTVPSPLLPRSVFKEMLDTILEYAMDKFVTDQSFFNSYTGAATVKSFIANTGFIFCDGSKDESADPLDAFGPWQHDFGVNVVGHMMLYSDSHGGVLEDWRELYEFICKGTTQRFTGTLKSRGAANTSHWDGRTTWAGCLQNANGGSAPAATSDGHFTTDSYTGTGNPDGLIDYPVIAMAACYLMILNGYGSTTFTGASGTAQDAYDYLKAETYNFGYAMKHYMMGPS